MARDVPAPGALLHGVAILRVVIADDGGWKVWKAWEPTMLHVQVRPDGSVRTIVGTPDEARNMERLL